MLWSDGTINEIDIEGNADELRIGSSQRSGTAFAGLSNVNAISIGGDFTGDFPATTTKIRMQSLGRLEVGGDFDTDLTVADGLPASGLIRVNGELSTDARIRLTPADGLEGQIVINADGVGGDQWLGDIEVGSVTLARDYTQTRAALGGGSVGVVPFRNHDSSCFPAGGSLVATFPEASAVRYTHYGAIGQATSGMPTLTGALIVERRNIAASVAVNFPSRRA